MKKKLPTHDDTPSVPLEPKVIETEAPNYEGDVRGTKYEIDEDRPLAQPLTAPTSKSVERAYPISDDEVDKYAVDTRIWDRMAELLDGSGGDAGPHTHSNYADKTHEHDYLTDLPTHDHPHNHDGDYADKQTLADHLANHPSGGDAGPHTHNEYSLTAHGHNDLATKEELTVGLGGKANTTHGHNEYQPKGDYATKTELTNGLATKSPTTHTHPAPTGFWGMWKGTQAEFDALSTKSDKTLYVVV